MTPEISARPWDFTPVLDLLHALSPSTSDRPSTPPPILSGDPPSALGDFDRLWEYLGKPIDIPPRKVKYNVDSSPSDHDLPSTASSSPPDDIDNTEQAHRIKEVRWIDELDGTDLDDSVTNYISRAVSRSSPAGSRKRARSRTQPDPAYISEDDISRVRVSSLRLKVDPAGWRPPPLPAISVDPTIIRPIYTLTEAEKRKKLTKKLLAKYGVEEGSRLAKEDRIRPASMWNDNISIHVFVDCSNMIIGFYNALKKARGVNIHAYIKQPPLSFQSLALVMERGRPVARRILLGSTSRSIGGDARLPAYVTEAGYCGYELNILERVLKPKDRTPRRKKKAGTGNGYATSGQSSGSEASSSGARVMVEQGVDEILHMKLLETLVDYQKPTTIVLASGDAAEAEYSGGFLKNVERALTRGWKVELVSWKDNLSQAYLSPEFLEKWKDRFMIVELDDYTEELLAIYVQPHTRPASKILERQDGTFSILAKGLRFEGEEMMGTGSKGKERV